MVDLKSINPQYITNEAGERTAVILPVEEFSELLEDLEDLAVIAGRSGEETIPHEEVRARLKRDGLLSD